MANTEHEITRLRKVLSDILHEFESDHTAVMDAEHEADEAKHPELCNYCRIIAEAHAVLCSTTQLVPQAPAEPPKPVDFNCTLMAPNGKRIVKILEEVLVDYALSYVYRNEDGEIEFDYDGTQSSDVSWESADPVVDDAGEYTFVDEENGYWKGCQLVKSTHAADDDNYNSEEDDWYGQEEKKAAEGGEG